MTVTVHKVKEVLINNSNQDNPHKMAKNSYDLSVILTCLKTQLKVRQFRGNQKIKMIRLTPELYSLDRKTLTK